MEEIRKGIEWYEWLYEISNLWRIRSLDRHRKHSKWWLSTQKWCILKFSKNNEWYKNTKLSNNWIKKWYLLHRLLWIHFINNPDNKTQINHKNWVRDDNRLSNLEWVTPRENNLHAYKYLWHKSPRKWMLWVKHPCSKEVIQYSLDWKYIKKWDSFWDVQRTLWYNQPLIHRCCNKKYINKTAYWYKRSYI